MLTKLRSDIVLPTVLFLRFVIPSLHILSLVQPVEKEKRSMAQKEAVGQCSMGR